MANHNHVNILTDLQTEMSNILQRGEFLNAEMERRVQAQKSAHDKVVEEMRKDIKSLTSRVQSLTRQWTLSSCHY